MTVPSTLRRVLSFEMTIAEWIGTALMLAVPYLLVGLLWSFTHPGQVLRSIACWPVLVLSTVCMT
jgi:hypothetical protein